MTAGPGSSVKAVEFIETLLSHEHIVILPISQDVPSRWISLLDGYMVLPPVRSILLLEIDHCLCDRSRDSIRQTFEIDYLRHFGSMKETARIFSVPAHPVA